MQRFNSDMIAYWDGLFDSGHCVPTADGFSLMINPNLSAERRAIVMVPTQGRTRVAVAPGVASALGIESDGAPIVLAQFREALCVAGIEMHAPDIVYYVAAPQVPTTPSSAVPDVRLLRADDAALFDAFMAQISDDDQDDAYVELDRWATFGAFVESELLAVSSMYPWGGAAIADMGVLTMPKARGKGLASALVRAMIEHASRHGYEAQYRCQFDNVASNALAQSLGLAPFGRWEVARSA